MEGVDSEECKCFLVQAILTKKRQVKIPSQELAICRMSSSTSTIRHGRARTKFAQRLFKALKRLEETMRPEMPDINE
ncbi:hypothetical protein Nmel_005412 [Mimus melanotis]